MIIEPWQAEAWPRRWKPRLQLAYQEMAGIEERSNQFMESRRVEYTMSSLEAVGNHLAGIPGRKNLIWMTSGVPMISAQTRDPWPENYVATLRRVAQKLASQGIAMYPVEASGVRPLYLNVNAGVRGIEPWRRRFRDGGRRCDCAHGGESRSAAECAGRARSRRRRCRQRQMRRASTGHDGSVRRSHRRPRPAQHERSSCRRQSCRRGHARHVFSRLLCAAGVR